MMRITWIRVATDLPDHPKSKLLDIAIGEHNAWAYVARLWMWCSNYAQDGRIPTLVAGIAEKAAGWTGEPEILFRHLANVGFIGEETNHWVVHKWDEHQGAAIRRAKKDSKRKVKFREEKRKERKLTCDADATRTGRGPAVARLRRTSGVPDVTGRDVTGPDVTRSFKKKKQQPLPLLSRELPAPVKVERPTLPEADWLGQDFQRWAQFKRSEAGLVPEDPLPILALEAWWGLVREAIGPQVRAVQRAFIAFGDDSHWQKQKPPLPFRAFVKQWRSYMPQSDGVSNAQG